MSFKNLLAIQATASFLLAHQFANALELPPQHQSEKRILAGGDLRMENKRDKLAFWQSLLAFFIFQFFIGVIMFEWSYFKLRKFRDGNEERDAVFPEYRRYDAKDWSRAKFYPGVVFMSVRVFVFLCALILLANSIKILCIGHDFRKGPIPDGCRKRLIGYMYTFFCSCGIFLAGMST